ncbi:MAG: hypothetical protein AB7J30_00415 [Hyphomicrobium sp.]|uniref:hypothetical protein n=1 Tax=Hyphomicrobium sp. TaxID=82 RepID=UPI003D112063
MTSVRETFGLACPKCGQDDRLHVSVETFVHLLPDGSEGVGDDEWGPFSRCGCTACDYWATVENFDITKGGRP